MMTHFYFRKILFVILLMGLCGCTSKLYQPDSVYRIIPTRFKQKAPQEVLFYNKSGVALTGWYFKSGPRPKGQILFFHGNSQNMTTHFATLHWVIEKGYDLFIFDYQGYGKSAGKPSPKGTVQDGEAALKWLHEKNPKVPIIVFGQSLGGAIGMRTVIEAQHQKFPIPIAAVVVDSTFLSYKSAAASVMSHHWQTWLFQPLAYLLISDRYAPKSRVKEIAPIPMLIFHGDQDKVISYNRGQKIYQKSLEPKTFVTTPGGRHGDVFSAKHIKNREIFLNWLHRSMIKIR